MIYMFLSNNPSSGDINSSNLSCSNYAPGTKMALARCRQATWSASTDTYMLALNKFQVSDLGPLGPLV